MTHATASPATATATEVSAEELAEFRAHKAQQQRES